MIEQSRMLIQDYRSLPETGAQYLADEEARLAQAEARVDRRECTAGHGRPMEGTRRRVRQRLTTRTRDRAPQSAAGLRPAAAGQAAIGADRTRLRRRSRTDCPATGRAIRSIRGDGWDNEIAVLSRRGAGNLTTLYRPAGTQFVGDVDLHFDADRLLFSSLGSHKAAGRSSRSGPTAPACARSRRDLADVDNYDACYLPDGRIIFSSTASIAAVPCVNGSSLVANLYRMDADGANIRQLCFDQDHNWCPTVLNNGRVLYLRWEYTDTPHSHAACCST